MLGTKNGIFLPTTGLLLFGAASLTALMGAGQAGHKKPVAKTTGVKTVVTTGVSAEAVKLGASVYESNGCAVCHAIKGKGGATAPDLTNSAGNPEHTAVWFKDQIENPKKHNPNSTMPAYAGKIKAPQLASLVVFMGSLKTIAAAASTAPIETGEIRSWAYTTKQAPSEDHVNVQLVRDAKKKVTGQIVISVEQPAKMFYALGLSPTSKKELLLGLKPEMRNEARAEFKVIFTGGKATIETDGKYNGGDGNFVPAHLTMTLFGIGSLNPTGNPLGEMKVGFTVIAKPTKAVLWKSDVKKVTNGYVRVEAPE